MLGIGLRLPELTLNSAVETTDYTDGTDAEKIRENLERCWFR